MHPTTILKVSVFATGELLLDGRPATLSSIEEALVQGKKENAAVWYFREKAEGEPPPVAIEVLKLITTNRLPIRLSSKADFSDSVTPDVTDLDRVFRPIREKAAQGNLVVLRSDGKQLLLPALPKGSTPTQAVAAIERMLPSSAPRNIVSICDTAWAMAPTPDLRAANQAIPFFGLLMGFSSIGHAVWVYDTNSVGVFAAACREADVLIVGSDRVAKLPPGWEAVVSKAMRNPDIMIYDAATAQFSRLGPPSA